MREVDFYLLNGNKQYRCEVKLMGKGNPESADAVIARDSSIFVADKLSEQNKTQLERLNVEWIELRSEDGFRKFKKVLETLGIPHDNIPSDDLDYEIEKVFKEIFNSGENYIK